MISIGNDIIDLKHTNAKRTAQEKFYLKIICKEELELFKGINSAQLSFAQFVWMAWSIKESAYKFYKRCKPEILFSPTKIIIQKIQLRGNNFLLNNEEHEAVSFLKEACYCCKIYFDEQIFFTRTLLHDDLIFTVADNNESFSNVHWGIKKIDDNNNYKIQSENVRKFALKKLNTIFLNDDLSIEKSEFGYPYLKQQKEIPLSFSHHGNYVAYSFTV